MRWRRLAPTWNGRTLGISLLILSLVHTPLPQPDFHNIRHHDGPGEVCEHHDHLLRWHPGAGVARDVAVLHWHWFLPADPGTDPPAEGSGRRSTRTSPPGRRRRGTTGRESRPIPRRGWRRAPPPARSTPRLHSLA